MEPADRGGIDVQAIVARAAEQAFPQALPALALTQKVTPRAARSITARAVDPLLGHCPPSSLADAPASADLHDLPSHVR